MPMSADIGIDYSRRQARIFADRRQNDGRKRDPPIRTFFCQNFRGPQFMRAVLKTEQIRHRDGFDALGRGRRIRRGVVSVQFSERRA